MVKVGHTFPPCTAVDLFSHFNPKVRGPVVQEGERLAEALLTNHQVLPELYMSKAKQRH